MVTTAGRAQDVSGQGGVRPGFKSAPQSVFVLGLAVVVLALCSALATYFILTGLTSIVPTHRVVVTVLAINGLLALIMIALIAWQVSELWRARRRQVAGARLHVRIVALFSVVAVLPAILLAIFASVALDRGLDHWFSSRTKTIIENSINVATAYLNEHGQVLRADAVGMAADIDEAVSLVRTQPHQFSRFLTAQASIRALPFAYLVDGEGNMLATAHGLSDTPYEAPPSEALEAGEDGTAVMISPGQTNKVGAVKKLDNFDDTYLYVVRTVNPQVLQHLRATRAQVAEYQELEQRRTGVQVAFALMYLAIALMLLLAAIWLGLWFANRLVAPIRQLIGAAQQVSEGNLNIQVEASPREGDLGQLGTTFNTMTSELRSQRDELVDANTMLDERRRFTEAVLSGVTAGVVGLDANGNITLANPSAEILLNIKRENLLGRRLADVVPEFASLLTHADAHDKKPVHDQITLGRMAQERNFAVRVTNESSDKTNYGYVVTFDDITELVTAQRTSAWADVARRIAHEIKNPLTPIQLSAERLKRKYGASIKKDRDVFDQCTDTIIRQVGDIGRMVDEFSAFARMPKPVMEANDIREIVREAVFLFQVGHPDISFAIDVPDEPVISLCDRRLISQAVTNLAKNASEAVEARAADAGADYRGHIVARLRGEGGRFTIDVIDNGCGLPQENRNRLVEPYMTTRDKGTGLGLAIVQKVTEQHGGTVQLRDAPMRDGEGGGAWVRLDLPVMSAAPPDGDVAEPADSAGRDKATEAASEGKEEVQGVTHGV